MPDHIHEDYPEFPLPEVTITPVEAPDGFSGPSSFIPQRLMSEYFVQHAVFGIEKKLKN